MYSSIWIYIIFFTTTVVRRQKGVWFYTICILWICNSVQFPLHKTDANIRACFAHYKIILSKTAFGNINTTYFISDFAWHSVNCFRSSLISWPLVAFWRVCTWAQFSHIGSGSSQVLQKCDASVWMFPQRQGSQNISFSVSWSSLLMIILKY